MESFFSNQRKQRCLEIDKNISIKYADLTRGDESLRLFTSGHPFHTIVLKNPAKKYKQKCVSIPNGIKIFVI